MSINRSIILFISAISLITAHFSFYAEGFLAGTLVKTPIGYRTIEELKIGDTVFCYDMNASMVEKRIIATIKQKAPCYIKLIFENEFLLVSEDRKILSA